MRYPDSVYILTQTSRRGQHLPTLTVEHFYIHCILHFDNRVYFAYVVHEEHVYISILMFNLTSGHHKLQQLLHSRSVTVHHSCSTGRCGASSYCGVLIRHSPPPPPVTDTDTTVDTTHTHYTDTYRYRGYSSGYDDIHQDQARLVSDSGLAFLLRRLDINIRISEWITASVNYFYYWLFIDNYYYRCWIIISFLCEFFQRIVICSINWQYSLFLLPTIHKIWRWMMY